MKKLMNLPCWVWLGWVLGPFLSFLFPLVDGTCCPRPCPLLYKISKHFPQGTIHKQRSLRTVGMRHELNKL